MSDVILMVPGSRDACVHLRMLIKKTPISPVGKESEDGSNIDVEVAGPSVLVACLGG